MINMSVRDQNGVAAINTGAQTLLAMVGWNINQDHARLASGVCELQHGASSQALVTRISALTCGAVATNHRVALGRRGTDYCRRSFDQVLLNYLCAARLNYFSGPGNAFVVRFMLAATIPRKNKYIFLCINSFLILSKVGL